MPKAVALSADLLKMPPMTPQAATAPRAAAIAPPVAKAPKVALVPLQIRIPAADAKAIKLAAVNADQTISEYMLACFHAYTKA